MMSTLVDKVRAWVESEGFPLEMRLRKAFVDAKYQLAQSAYLDDDTGKYRAGADVVAYKSVVVPAAAGSQYRVYAFAVVECKLGGSKPWVMFMQSRHGAGIGMVQQLTSTSDDRALIERIVGGKYRKKLEPKLQANGNLIAPEKVAYAVSEFEGKSDRSKPFDAIRQVIDGSLGVVREHKRFWSGAKHKNSTTFAAANFIVTKAPLFTCDLDASGKTLVTEVDNVVYVEFRGQGQTQRMHYIRIATEQYMVSRLIGLAEDLNSVATLLAEAMMESGSN